MLLDKIRIKD